MGSQSPPEGRALRHGFLHSACVAVVLGHCVSIQIKLSIVSNYTTWTMCLTDRIHWVAKPSRREGSAPRIFLRMLAPRKIGLRLTQLRRTAKDSSRTWYSSDRNIYATAKSITWTMYLIDQIAYGVAEPSRREGSAPRFAECLRAGRLVVYFIRLANVV